MSNLRERLLKIAAQPREPSPPPQICKVIQTRHNAYGVLDIMPEILCLLGCKGYTNPLFLDTETTGLGGGAGTIAFMVGVGSVCEDILNVKQYVMTDYGQEGDMLAQLERDLKCADALITYNGKSFDVPLLRGRFVMSRINPTILDKPHIDLLHIARRVYKRRLKSCSLSDIEREVLGICRENDLPGVLAPEYWFRFLKTGETRLIEEIERHNEQDIATLALLLRTLADAYAAPEQLTHQQDILSVGKSMEKFGEYSRARTYFLAAGRNGEALLALARIHRRNAHVADSLDALTRAAELGGENAFRAMIELSKLYEHRLRDYKLAIHWADEALRLCPAAEIPALTHRRARLRRKCTAHGVE